MVDAIDPLEEALIDATCSKSRFFEQLVEHVFIAEVLQEAWYGFGEVVEVLRSEVDASGFDVVLECKSILRHIQLKTSGPNAAVARQNVNIALADKPSGCIIWLLRDEDTKTHRISLRYRFFGGAPGKKLPSLDGLKVANMTRGNRKGFKKERPNIRIVPKNRFVAIETTRELVQHLFALGNAKDQD